MLELRPLEQVHVHRGPRRNVEAVLVGVAHDPDDRQQAQVAVHVSELDRAADRVLAGPARARERFGDQGHVRRIRPVALVEGAPAHEGNPENLEVALGHRAEVRDADALLLLEESPDVLHGLRGVLRRRQQEHAVRMAAVERQTARRADLADARDLLEPVDQARIEDRLAGPGPGILQPRQRNVHRDDLVHAEPGIDLEHLHEAAAEQSRPDHEHQRDRDLGRHDDPAHRAGCPASPPARARPPRGPRAGPRKSRARP